MATTTTTTTIIIEITILVLIIMRITSTSLIIMILLLFMMVVIRIVGTVLTMTITTVRRILITIRSPFTGLFCGMHCVVVCGVWPHTIVYNASQGSLNSPVKQGPCYCMALLDCQYYGPILKVDTEIPKGTFFIKSPKHHMNIRIPDSRKTRGIPKSMVCRILLFMRPPGSQFQLPKASFRRLAMIFSTKGSPRRECAVRSGCSGVVLCWSLQCTKRGGPLYFKADSWNVSSTIKMATAWRLLCGSFLVMICFLIRDFYNILPEKNYTRVSSYSAMRAVCLCRVNRTSMNKSGAEPMSTTLVAVSLWVSLMMFLLVGSGAKDLIMRVL